MKGIDSNSKRIQFFKDKIKHRLTELRPYMSDVKYRMYMSVIGDCNDLDELREMAEMDLQFNMVKYLNELTDKIKLSDTSIDELEAVINQNARAAKLTVIMPKKREKQTYEEVVENIDEVLEDKDVLEASANILWQRLSSPVPEDIDITNLEEYEEDDLEVENEETTNIDEIDEYDDAALEEAYEEEEEEEEEDLFEIDEIDEYDDAALEEAYEEEEYLDGLDEIEDIDEEEDDTSEDIDLEDDTLEDEEDKPIDFGDTQEEEEPIDFGDSTVKETEENEEDSFGLDSLDISDMYSLGEETDDEEDDDELINIDDLLDEDSQAYDPDDDYAMDEDDDDEEDDLNIDDMYGDDEDEEDYDEEEADDIEEEEEDEYDEYDDYANEEDTGEADEDEDEDELDPDDMFGDDEEDEEEEEDTEEDNDLNPDDMFGDEEEDAFDIDESELTGDIDDTDSDLDNLFDTTQSTTNNKNIQPQKRAKTQDKVFINGTQRGKQTQDMFNMIFGLANKISKVKNIRR